MDDIISWNQIKISWLTVFLLLSFMFSFSCGFLLEREHEIKHSIIMKCKSLFEMELIKPMVFILNSIFGLSSRNENVGNCHLLPITESLLANIYRYR